MSSASCGVGSREHAIAASRRIVTEAREAPKLRRVGPHTPPPAQIGRVLEKAGFSMVREMDDAI
jgi:hypothetical protein